ncbi:MAG: regulatory protein RecX [Acidaminococcaceae bacterium]
MSWKPKKPLTNYNEAYEFALNRLSYRDYSQKDLEVKLAGRLCPPDIIEQVVNKLVDYAFVNDERYAEKVFKNWLAKKYYGSNHLRMELHKKVVREDLIPQMLQKLSTEEELERALNAAQSYRKKNYKKYGEKNRECIANLARALTAKGFSGSMIRLTFNRLESNWDEESQLDT